MRTPDPPRRLRRKTPQLEALYESELAATRGLAAAFAEGRRKIAGRLGFDGGESRDPHVERLIQGFAFLTARVRLKLEDEFPELTDALLSVLAPHQTAPIPATGVVQFRPDPKTAPPETALHVPRGSGLETAEAEVAGTRVRCRFRTCADAVVWPVEVAAARYATAPFPVEFGLRGGLSDHPAALRVTLKHVAGRPLRELSTAGLSGAARVRAGADPRRDAGDGPPDRLRLQLADPGGSRVDFQLFDVLRGHAATVVFSPGPDGPDVVLPADDALHFGGFDDDEALFPAPRAGFPGYRLLTEYFAAPRRFLCFDLCGLRPALAAAETDELAVTILLDGFAGTDGGGGSRGEEAATGGGPDAAGLSDRVAAGNVAAGAVPVVNLFRREAAPQLATHRTAEYPITSGRTPGRAFEVYSVDAVSCVNSDTGAVTRFRPYYAPERGGRTGGAVGPRDAAERDDYGYASNGYGGRFGGGDGDGRYFHVRRRPSPSADDPGTDCTVALVDLNFDPHKAPVEVLACDLTCTNRDLPAAPIDDWGLTLETPAPILPPKLLGRFAPPRRVPAGQARWRLISHLSLNHLSITGGEDGAAAFREALALYGEALAGDRDGGAEAAAHVAAVAAVTSRRTTKRVLDGRHAVVARGVELTVDLNRDRFAGGSPLLFASVLDRFAARYASLNSFVQVRTRWAGSDRPFRTWPVRAGDRPVV